MSIEIKLDEWKSVSWLLSIIPARTSKLEFGNHMEQIMNIFNDIANDNDTDFSQEKIDALVWLDDILPGKYSNWRTINQWGFNYTGALTHYDSEVEDILRIIKRIFKNQNILTRDQKRDKAYQESDITLTGINFNYKEYEYRD